MSSKFNERVYSTVPEYRRLVSILTSTNHAPKHLSQQEDLITALKTEITASDTRVASAEAQRLSEQADHTKYQTSTFRRLAHKASGKSSRYTAKAAKEESEYLAAVQAEHTEKQHNAALRFQLAEAESLAESLKPAATQHDQAKAGLETLLSSLFDGPTPDYPDEDSAENDVSLAQEAYRSAQTALRDESLALEHLKSSQLAMRAAVAASNDALRIATHLDAVSDRDELRLLRWTRSLCRRGCHIFRRRG
ncbi:hypothetical protein QBC34DRAFT_400854 [Podospora aff. communis PSN243]|uniref:Uncharacterized protein n=1 Tax=Podospora aff. communis PSN243 TaxID=3040156 RepID=A0AAV9GSY1_9PEZI|nr:hypothetical protein QBC34DRAFT_400854 [Podospora aff. communis PSN243]